MDATRQQHSSGFQPPPPLVVIGTILASIPLSLLVVAPWTIRLAALALGWMLRQGTEGRRAQLAALMDEENKKYREENKEPQPDSTGKYQKEGNADADDAQRNWDGFVGFFHPFW